MPLSFAYFIGYLYFSCFVLNTIQFNGFVVKWGEMYVNSVCKCVKMYVNILFNGILHYFFNVIIKWDWYLNVCLTQCDYSGATYFTENAVLLKSAYLQIWDYLCQ